MEYIKINNLKINQYTINLEFQSQDKIGVYAKDKKIVKTFLDIISGIDKNSNTCFFQDKDLFDNKEYFKSRLYFDFSKKYLSTLKTSYIQERFLNRFNRSFNKDKFNRIVKQLNVRGETEISYVYMFTPTGNTFVNYALTIALESRNIIINNPTIHLNLDSDIEAISKGLTDRTNFDSVILGLDRFLTFKNCLDKIMLFTDFDTVQLLDTNTSLIVFGEEYFPLENKLFQGENVICLNYFSKEDIKSFQKQRMDFNIISIYDIDNYLQVN